VSGALTGLRVVDLTTALSGPLCTMMLGDAGADVVKVESPSGDPTRHWGPPFWGDQGAEFLALNRNKRSIVVDLKTEAGRDLVLELCDQADIVVENYRRGVVTRLGIDYETVRMRNPRVVYCSLSGFGSTGPRREQAAYDSVMQAFTGTMALTGQPGGQPVRASTSVSDIGAGMYANQAVLLALLARTQTGEGQLVETSMFESQVAWLLFRAVGYFATGSAPKGRLGTASAHLAPYRAYETIDGHVMVAALNDGLYRRLVSALGLPELAEDSRFLTNRDRVANREVLDEALEQRFAQEPTAHWSAVLIESGVPCSPINSVEDVLNDEQTKALGMIAAIEHPTLGEIRVPGIPITMHGTPGSIRRPPPLLGADTRDVLHELGYGEAAVQDLLERVVVTDSR
jgi:crotonobetainyl-CoA:carnitine CoA-transferase CaiB-like acyl-CoA transferase